MPAIEVAGRSIHYRAHGRGSPVVLLHSSSSHSGQWKGLMQKLAPRHRSYAPDLHGYGRSAPLPRDGQPYFVHDLALLDVLLEESGAPVHLIGHSLGGTVAVHAALKWPARVKSLALVEPVLFHLVENTGDPRINDYVALALDMLVLDYYGKHESAARHFLDYWIGPAALDAMDPHRREYIVSTVSRVSDDWLGISRHAPGQCRLEDLAGIQVPALLVCGEQTRPAARAIVEALLSAMPGIEYQEIPGAGHLSPLTHPQAVNDVISSFLTRLRSDNTL